MENPGSFEVQYAHPSVGKFVLALDAHTKAKIERLIGLFESRGPILGMPFTRKIVQHIFELRVLGSPNARFLYTYKGRTIWILHGISKKRDSIPAKDIARAQARMRAVLHI